MVQIIYLHIIIISSFTSLYLTWGTGCFQPGEHCDSQLTLDINDFVNCLNDLNIIDAIFLYYFKAFDTVAC